MSEKEKNNFINFNDFISGFDKKIIEVKKENAEEDSLTDSVDLYKQKSVGLIELLKVMVANKASDLHINSNEKPVIRIYGDLKFLDMGLIKEETITELVYPLMLPEHISCLSEKGYVDFVYEEINLGRFRVNLYKHIMGIGASFRHIPKNIPKIEELNLPQVIKNIPKYRKGLVLITGATGSGKSTTLASIINEINLAQKKHIITIEDPLEFVHVNEKSRITHREIGEHANNFSTAIISALRSDPDVLVIGEMRDLETISQALIAAETGVLVMATLHTNSAAKAVERIINVFPAGQQGQIRLILAEVLCAVISQQLIRKADKKGRVPAVEVLLSCPGLSNLIREGKSFYVNSMIQTGREFGMRSMDYELFRIYKEGIISLADARAYAFDLKYFEQLEGKK